MTKESTTYQRELTDDELMFVSGGVGAVSSARIAGVVSSARAAGVVSSARAAGIVSSARAAGVVSSAAR